MKGFPRVGKIFHNWPPCCRFLDRCLLLESLDFLFLSAISNWAIHLLVFGKLISDHLLVNIE